MSSSGFKNARSSMELPWGVAFCVTVLATHLLPISKCILWTLLIFLCSLISPALCLCVRYCVLSETCVTRVFGRSDTCLPSRTAQFLKCTERKQTSARKSGSILTQYHWVQGTNIVWALVSTLIMKNVDIYKYKSYAHKNAKML